jgi:hypothetical protein
MGENIKGTPLRFFWYNGIGNIFSRFVYFLTLVRTNNLRAYFQIISPPNFTRIIIFVIQIDPNLTKNCIHYWASIFFFFAFVWLGLTYIALTQFLCKGHMATLQGRPQVPLCTLLQAQMGNKVEPPTVYKPAGQLPHI